MRLVARRNGDPIDLTLSEARTICVQHIGARRQFLEAIRPISTRCSSLRLPGCAITQGERHAGDGARVEVGQPPCQGPGRGLGECNCACAKPHGQRGQTQQLPPAPSCHRANQSHSGPRENFLSTVRPVLRTGPLLAHSSMQAQKSRVLRYARCHGSEVTPTFRAFLCIPIPATAAFITEGHMTQPAARQHGTRSGSIH